jgi:PHD/YefM family antitoxin component YafN of YafNO toxin-antitoxin module
MSGLDALQSVQFVTVKGKRFAILSADDWEALIDWLETLEDVQVARQAFAELKAADDDRNRAGWLKWRTS